MLYTRCQKWLQLRVKIPQLSAKTKLFGKQNLFLFIPNNHYFLYLTSTEIDGRAFTSFSGEISDYLTVFKYAWRSQQEPFFRKFWIPP